MIQELQAFYETQGIASVGFRCRHTRSCSRGWKCSARGKAAFVSGGYEQHTAPRVLFVTSTPEIDPAYEKPEDRTALRVREIEESLRDFAALPESPHALTWCQTQGTARHLLQPFLGETLSEDQARRYFALTYSGKCTPSREDQPEPDEQFFRNCREYVGREIEILAPEIVVSLGKWAMEAVGVSFTQIAWPTSLPPWERFTEAGLIRIRGRVALWIRAAHPRYAKGFNPWLRKIQTPEYADLLQRFIHR